MEVFNNRRIARFLPTPAFGNAWNANANEGSVSGTANAPKTRIASAPPGRL
jgi:hypothetical protein